MLTVNFRISDALVALLATASVAHAQTPAPAPAQPQGQDMSGMQGMSGMSGMDHDKMKMDGMSGSGMEGMEKGMKMKGKMGGCMKMKGMDMSNGHAMAPSDHKMKMGCGDKESGMKMPMGPQSMPDAVHQR